MAEVSAAAAFAEQEATVEARRKQNELKAKATRISAAEEESEALRKGLGHSKTVSAKEKQLLERQRDSMHSRLVATDDGRRALEKQLQAQKASAVPLLSPIRPAPIASVPADVGSGPGPAGDAASGAAARGREGGISAELEGVRADAAT